MDEVFSKEEFDLIGEIANISMGNSATTMSMMVNTKVDITIPNVKLIRRREALDDYEGKCFFVNIHYIKGLIGDNILVLKENDIKIITDLMMGGDGRNVDGEITEMHKSAVAEAMNQMMGTSATAVSSMLGIATDISVPGVNVIDVDSIKVFERMFDVSEDYFIKVTFRLKVGDDLIDSVMSHLYPIDFAKEMCEKFVAHQKELEGE